LGEVAQSFYGKSTFLRCKSTTMVSHSIFIGHQKKFYRQRTQIAWQKNSMNIWESSAKWGNVMLLLGLE
jgi:hypothetical protein